MLAGDDRIRDGGAGRGGQQAGQLGGEVRHEVGGGPADVGLGGRQGHSQALAAVVQPGALGAVEHELRVGPDAGEEGQVRHRPVVHQMDVDDRGGAQLDQAILEGDGARRQQRPDRVVGHRDHHGVGLQDLPVRLDLQASGRAGPHGGHRDAGHDLAARGLQGPPGGIGVQGRQRHPRPADIGRGSLGEEPGHEHSGGQLEGGVGRAGVDGREHDQVPERLGGDPVLPVGRQPVTETHVVQGRVVWV